MFVFLYFDLLSLLVQRRLFFKPRDYRIPPHLGLELLHPRSTIFLCLGAGWVAGFELTVSAPRTANYAFIFRFVFHFQYVFLPRGALLSKTSACYICEDVSTIPSPLLMCLF